MVYVIEREDGLRPHWPTCPLVERDRRRPPRQPRRCMRSIRALSGDRRERANAPGAVEAWAAAAKARMRSSGAAVIAIAPARRPAGSRHETQLGFER
jgi:hypothetical protein